jgi:hypothetical protein
MVHLSVATHQDWHAQWTGRHTNAHHNNGTKPTAALSLGRHKGTECRMQ